MQDRISLYPGRVTLTPVAGQENTYDLVRADQPTQEGTPLNKANLLTDATAALYGLGSSAVPNEVLAKIKTLVDAANANADSRAKVQVGYYVGTGLYGKDNPCSVTFDFAPKLFVLMLDSSRDPALDLSIDTWFNEIPGPFMIADLLPISTDGTPPGGGSSAGITINTRYAATGYKSADGKTFYWYQSNGYQFSSNGHYYYYMAIG